MTLKEYIAANADKEIEIQGDGTIKVLGKKEARKPMRGECYWRMESGGEIGFSKWYDCEIENMQWRIGNFFRTREEAERMRLRLRVRKKFLDAGGHEGLEGFTTDEKFKAYPARNKKVVFSGSCHEVAAFDIWFETEGDCLRAINSLNEQEIEALCWQGEEE